eukprot:7796744-Pyramimonas_sp.AAC.1
MRPTTRWAPGRAKPAQGQMEEQEHGEDKYQVHHSADEKGATPKNKLLIPPWSTTRGMSARL